jgi:hypothetical protein
MDTNDYQVQVQQCAKCADFILNVISLPCGKTICASCNKAYDCICNICKNQIELKNTDNFRLKNNRCKCCGLEMKLISVDQVCTACKTGSVSTGDLLSSLFERIVSPFASLCSFGVKDDNEKDVPTLNNVSWNNLPHPFQRPIQGVKDVKIKPGTSLP